MNGEMTTRPNEGIRGWIVLLIVALLVCGLYWRHQTKMLALETARQVQLREMADQERSKAQGALPHSTEFSNTGGAGGNISFYAGAGSAPAGHGGSIYICDTYETSKHCHDRIDRNSK